MNITTPNRQIFFLLAKCYIFSHFSVDQLSTREATNMPFVCWPDGSPCALGNLYMLTLMNRHGRSGRGLSRRGTKGGSMGEYAMKIGQLIRYCFRHRKNFIDMDDHDFTEFINALRREKSQKQPLASKKNESTITSTGRVCLDFLSYVGRIHGNAEFVSPKGCIRVAEHSEKKMSKAGRVRVTTYLHHHSFSYGSRTHRRNPVPTDHILKIKNAINQSSNSAFIRERRRCLVALLEQTGARRTEIGHIKIADVIEAYIMKEPMLRLDTLKQGEHRERFIPVTKMLLHDLKNHIDIRRRQIIKSKLSLNADHGFLFASAVTGKHMSSDSISSEIALLRKAAGIEEAVCPHMFRHAFITNLFALILLRHKMNTQDDFQRALLDSETFKAEVMQWTGHLDKASLDRYITLARASLSHYSETISSVHLIRVLQAFREKEDELMQRLMNGMPNMEYRAAMLSLRRLFDEDRVIAGKRKSALP